MEEEANPQFARGHDAQSPATSFRLDANMLTDEDLFACPQVLSPAEGDPTGDPVIALAGDTCRSFIVDGPAPISRISPATGR